MTFSKSFGYAVRGVLYIAVMQNEKHYVQVEEIAARLAVPRHFVGKILKKLVKENVLASAKGRTGGFTLNEDTLQLPLIRLIDITDSVGIFSTCVLCLKECNASNPCPMHHQMEDVNARLKKILSGTTIGDLIGDNKPDFIQSLSTVSEADYFVSKSLEKNIY
jgi:Rrf2 family protein